MYDVIIIGSGPAGISAALYTQRGGLKTLIISKGSSSLEKAHKIQNYYGLVEEISGKELYKIGIEQAKRIGVEIIEDEVVQISNEKNFKVTTINAEYDATNVILATGINRKESTIKGIKEYEGKGISYCAVCDAFFFRGKDVAVIGDGNYAVHEAEILKPIAKSVRIITNGKSMVQNRNIDVETIKDSVKEVKGKDILEEIEFANGKTIKIDGVFVAEGIATSTDLAKRIGALVEGNNIKINENMETSVKGLYACGDCTGGILQIAKATYEGMVAGISIIKNNKNIALITDAGMPCISDPGYILVKQARENNIEVIGVGGISAVTTALSISGLDTKNFSFYGFFPRENKTKKRIIKEIKQSLIKVFVFYESPKRLIDTLEFLKEELNNFNISAS